VIINPGLGWGKDPAAQGPEFSVLGMPRDGTFAGEVAIEATQVHEKPSHLDWYQAAALPLAGLTAWRAVFTQGGLQPGETVLITGVGGGVATFALQFAIAAGAHVWVTSSSQDKINRAIDLGALGGFDYRDDDWGNKLTEAAGSPHLIIDSAGGSGYRSLLHVVAPGGRIVSYGSTAGAPDSLDLFKVFWKQLRLQGSTMGSPEDFAAMLKFTGEKRLVPIVDSVTPLADGNRAIGAMKSSPQFGKLVLSIDA
jgi:NADPH:quinone reductase-like Zn-dependent oxidoreductase